MGSLQKRYALILGVILLIAGIWGLFTDEILGIFGGNTTQSALYLVVGVLGVYAGTKKKGRGFNGTIGWIGVLIGILGFLPYTSEILTDLLNANTATTWLHLAIGVVSLLVYYGSK